MSTITSKLTRRIAGRVPGRSTRRDERGMTTSEYAVGTVGACGIGGILYELANSEWFTNLLKGVIDQVTGLLPF